MIYQLKVSLKNVTKPPVWRRILVPSNYTFDDLHLVIQAAMGWEDCHLYQFGYRPYDRACTISVPRDDDWVPPTANALTTPIDRYLNPTHPKMTYVYDFGDDWIHNIVLEKAWEDNDAEQETPLCVDAKGACPPEDCGGPWGYEELKALAAMKTIDEDDAERLEWFGIFPEEFDPKEVDLSLINTGLQRLRAVNKPREKKVDEKKLQERISLLIDIIEKWCKDNVKELFVEDVVDECKEIIDLMASSQYNLASGKTEIWAAAILTVATSDMMAYDSKTSNRVKSEICSYFGLKEGGVNGRITNIHNAQYIQMNEELFSSFEEGLSEEDIENAIFEALLGEDSGNTLFEGFLDDDIDKISELEKKLNLDEGTLLSVISRMRGR